MFVTKKSRRDWVHAGLHRLASHGVEGVRVEPLSRDLGVTKGSFYWHFADRSELLDAMLEEWAEAATEAVIDQAEAAGTAAETRMRRLTEIATERFDAELELELRAWGRRDARVGEVLLRVDRRRTDYLRRLLRQAGFEPAETEARAFLAYAILFGNHLLPAPVGRLSRKRLLRDAFSLVSAPLAKSAAAGSDRR